MLKTALIASVITLAHTLAFDSLLAERVSSQLTYQDSKTRQRTYENRFAAGQAQNRIRDSNYQEKLWAFNSMLYKAFDWGDESASTDLRG